MASMLKKVDELTYISLSMPEELDLAGFESAILMKRCHFSIYLCHHCLEYD